MYWVTTTVARHSQTHINILTEHIVPSNPAAASLMTSLKSGMVAQGMDTVTAAHQAYAAVFSMVERQAAMLSYVDAFRFLSAMFVMVLPLIFIMKKPKGPGGPGSMGH